MSRAPSVENTANPSRRVAIRALLILVAITVVLAAATAVHLFTRPTPYSGNWVGPGNFPGGRRSLRHRNVSVAEAECYSAVSAERERSVSL